MGVRINCMVADALRYTQEASFPKLIAKSMRVRAPFWILKYGLIVQLKRILGYELRDWGLNPYETTNRKVGRAVERDGLENR